MKKLNILVANDDGVNAKGIRVLAKFLKKYGDVFISAPATARSAASHGITLHKALSFDFVGEDDGVLLYQTSGKPADATRLGLMLIDKDFDIVFSGINNGLNVGTDIIYSGTVAAAREALIYGYPAVSISCDVNSLDKCEAELEKVLDMIFDKALYSNDYVLNVNFPDSSFDNSLGIKICSQGRRFFNSEIVKTENGYVSKDLSCEYDETPGTDVAEMRNGYITLTALSLIQSKGKIQASLEDKLNKK